MKFTVSTRISVAGISSVLLSLGLGWLVSIPASLAVAQTVPIGDSSACGRIGVLGLFHPRRFTVSAPAGQALVVHAGEESVVIEKSSGVDSASVRISADGVLLMAGPRAIQAPALTVAGRNNETVDFVLAVPEKITRRYHGTLEIKPSSGTLIAIVTMDRETAVASVVAAEYTPDTPLEALKAQAVAARSYFVAGRGRHHDFDFCDTTHCQFLREPPAPAGAVSKAVAATRDLVLAYDSAPFAAMYTRSCSGQTRTPAELGLPSASYPYYSVECKHCRAHPVRWVNRLSAQDAAGLHSSDEAARLNMVRRRGWAAVPSNDFVVQKERDQILLKGTGQGHGIGLCQAGAKAMAEESADFRQILSHYYPNTTIVSWPSAAACVWQSGRRRTAPPADSRPPAVVQ
jgi:stage II sporulation protein D